jgi:hypothetical protein
MHKSGIQTAFLQPQNLFARLLTLFITKIEFLALLHGFRFAVVQSYAVLGGGTKPNN